MADGAETVYFTRELQETLARVFLQTRRGEKGKRHESFYALDRGMYF